MRKIKFRAWDTIDKEMGVSFTLDDLYQAGLCQLKKKQEEKDYILMQFTGLHDKNGKEIYEGDILKIAGGLVGNIDFIEGGFVWKEPDGCWQHLADDYEQYSEVIGNIYENPELLKTNK